MKKLLGNIAYSFNNFYDGLNTQGQMVFSIIVLLIIILLVLLLFTYIYQGFKNKKRIKELNKIEKHDTKVVVKNASSVTESEKVSDNTIEIMDIASKIDKAINDNNSPVTLTSFEEDQEKTAIISIDELYLKAKELEIVDDENTGVNYLEKYNLEPSEVEEIVDKTTNNTKGEVKAFKVSQVISPVYGIKKEVSNENNGSY